MNQITEFLNHFGIIFFNIIDNNAYIQAFFLYSSLIVLVILIAAFCVLAVVFCVRVVDFILFSITCVYKLYIKPLFRRV